MCTSSARLENTLECYMDELVDCFEDFVKKSLLIISVAVGALVLMLGYVLKVVADRSQSSTLNLSSTPGVHTRTDDTTVNYAKNAIETAPNSSYNFSSIQKANKRKFQSGTQAKSSQSVTMSGLKKNCNKISSLIGSTGPSSSVQSFDEKVLKNIGLSNSSKGCMQSNQSLSRNGSISRILLPSMPSPTCIRNHHLSTPRQCSRYTANRNSCCSMCCADDDRR